MADITNRDDIIDSRDVEEAIDDLESEQTALVDEYTEAKEEADELANESESEWVATERLCNAINALASYWDLTPEEIDYSVAALDNPGDDFNGNEELHALKELRAAFENYTDWNSGAVLIRETYFQEYAQQLAEDIGAIDREAAWPACHIDWEAAAESLQMDYTGAEFDGVTYYAR